MVNVQLAADHVFEHDTLHEFLTALPIENFYRVKGVVNVRARKAAAENSGEGREAEAPVVPMLLNCAFGRYELMPIQPCLLQQHHQQQQQIPAQQQQRPEQQQQATAQQQPAAAQYIMSLTFMGSGLRRAGGRHQRKIAEGLGVRLDALKVA